MVPIVVLLKAARDVIARRDRTLHPCKSAFLEVGGPRPTHRFAVTPVDCQLHLGVPAGNRCCIHPAPHICTG